MQIHVRAYPRVCQPNDPILRPSSIVSRCRSRPFMAFTTELTRFARKVNKAAVPEQLRSSSPSLRVDSAPRPRSASENGDCCWRPVSRNYPGNCGNKSRNDLLHDYRISRGSCRFRCGASAMLLLKGTHSFLFAREFATSCRAASYIRRVVTGKRVPAISRVSRRKCARFTSIGE